MATNHKYATLSVLSVHIVLPELLQIIDYITADIKEIVDMVSWYCQYFAHHYEKITTSLVAQQY